MNFRVFKFSLMLIIVVFLTAFSHFRQSKSHIDLNNIKIIDSEFKFISKDSVNKLLKQINSNLSTHMKRDLNLKLYENALDNNDLIKKANVSINLEKILQVSLVERDPVFRILNKNSYVDNKGNITQTDTRFVSIQTRDVTNKFGGGVYEQALKNPNIKLGRYGITGKELTEVFDANDGALRRTIKDGQKFDENFQDYLAFEVIRHKLNRMNSIRGMSVQGGEVTTKLTTFSVDEQEALNELFPRLKSYTMSQLQNLTPQIAKVILSDLEKGIKPEKSTKRTGRFKR